MGRPYKPKRSWANRDARNQKTDDRRDSPPVHQRDNRNCYRDDDDQITQYRDFMHPES